MRISSRSVLAALAVAASAAPLQDDTVSNVCDANKNVWSSGTLFESAPVSRVFDAPGPDVDTIYGTPKNTPKAFEGNSKIGPAGGMGGSFKESDHFRVYGSQSDEQAAKALSMLEAAYDCYVNDLKWRTSGLSYNAKTDDGYAGPFYKENVFGKATLGNAAGVMYVLLATSWAQCLRYGYNQHCTNVFAGILTCELVFHTFRSFPGSSPHPESRYTSMVTH